MYTMMGYNYKDKKVRNMVSESYWWYAYGHFQAGNDNLPHFGEVFAHYRNVLCWTRQQAAQALKCTKRSIEMLESDKNIDKPRSNPRRAVLAQILKIPPVLLGVAIVAEEGDSTPSRAASSNDSAMLVFDSQTLTFYEDMLASCWELYYTSSVYRATKNIDLWLNFLAHEVKKAHGVKRDQLLSFLCRFYQLSSLAARDRNDLDRALSDEKQAISIAFELGNAELIASSFLRRTRIYLQKSDFQHALQDAEAALPYANHSRDPLKGKVYQIAAETYGRIAGSNQELQKKSLKLFDQVGRIVRKGNLEPDDSFVKLDITSLYVERSEALRQFKQFDDAQSALTIARDHLSPELTRWQINILLEEAETYLAQGEYDDSATLALDTLKLVDVLQLQGKKERIRRLYWTLNQWDANYPLVRLLGRELQLL
jgi:tetratricopeptide (TPR) repeat protein/DNA-binding XRE family transcriptional regulator